MTIELWSVHATGVMIWISIATQQFQLDIKAGVSYALSNRDTGPPASAAQERMMRTVGNQADVAIVWIALVVVEQTLGVSNTLTCWASVAMVR